MLFWKLKLLKFYFEGLKFDLMNFQLMRLRSYPPLRSTKPAELLWRNQGKNSLLYLITWLQKV